MENTEKNNILGGTTAAARRRRMPPPHAAAARRRRSSNRNLQRLYYKDIVFIFSLYCSLCWIINKEKQCTNNDK